MEQEIQPQQPVSPLPSPVRKPRNNAIALGIFIVIAAAGAYFALSRGKTAGPLEVRALMPVVEQDQPSLSYQDSIVRLRPIQPGQMAAEARASLNAAVEKSDSEIASRNSESPDYLFSFLYASDDRSFVLYMMTPTGSYCGDSEESGTVCDDAELKILDARDGSVTLLTKDFADGSGDVYLDQKDKIIIASAGSKYEIFGLAKPYSLRESTPAGSSSVLSNEFAASYDPETSGFLMENILSGRKISCTVTDEKAKNALTNDFDASRFAVSPDGGKIILFEGDNRFLWSDISDQWGSNSPACLNAASEAEIAGAKSISQIGKWYGNSDYFAYSGYGEDSFIYDFKARKQIVFMPWNGAITVGSSNNDGYQGSADLGYGGYRIQAVPDADKVDLYIVSKAGKKFLLNSYGGKSTYYAYAGTPSNWARVQQDKDKPNQFHILVLDGYNVRQALDVSFQP